MNTINTAENEDKQKASHKQTLIIIGGGSAAFSAAIKASSLGCKAIIINDGLPIGGTCVNVGCVPSKMLIRAAEKHFTATQNGNFKGIISSSNINSFKEVIEQKRELVAELRQAKYVDVIKDDSNVEIINGRGKIVKTNVVEVNGKEIAGDKTLIATGSSPLIADIPGLSQVDYLTNESAFELETLPKSLIVLGGRYIALEIAQMFSRFGSKVTVLQRSHRIIPTEDEKLSDDLANYLIAEGIDIKTGVKTKSVTDNDDIEVKIEINGKEEIVRAEKIIVATGRRANLSGLFSKELAIETTNNNSLKVNEYMETSIPGIYGAGDITGDAQFVYGAAYEGAIAAENALFGRNLKRDYTVLPWVIFTDPQVAGVGLDEKEAKEKRIDVSSATLPLSHVPRAIAAMNTKGFIRLFKDNKTDKLIGARILASEGSELLMEVSLAIKYGITVKQIVDTLHPYLTLSEGIKLAALTFNKDVSKLSCCAT